MLSKLIQLGENSEFSQELKQTQAKANAFIEPALGAYFSNLGMNPLQEGGT